MKHSPAIYNPAAHACPALPCPALQITYTEIHTDIRTQTYTRKQTDILKQTRLSVASGEPRPPVPPRTRSPPAFPPWLLPSWLQPRPWPWSRPLEPCASFRELVPPPLPPPLRCPHLHTHDMQISADAFNVGGVMSEDRTQYRLHGPDIDHSVGEPTTDCLDPWAVTPLKAKEYGETVTRRDK